MMKSISLTILLLFSLFSISQSEAYYVEHKIIKDDVIVTLLLSPEQNLVESDSGHVIYGTTFYLKVTVEGVVPQKLFVSGAACKISLVSKAEGKYKFTTSSHIGKRKLSVNYGATPVMFDLWIHPEK